MTLRKLGVLATLSVLRTDFCEDALPRGVEILTLMEAVGVLRLELGTGVGERYQMHQLKTMILNIYLQYSQKAKD